MVGDQGFRSHSSWPRVHFTRGSVRWTQPSGKTRSIGFLRAGENSYGSEIAIVVERLRALSLRASWPASRGCRSVWIYPQGIIPAEVKNLTLLRNEFNNAATHLKCSILSGSNFQSTLDETCVYELMIIVKNVAFFFTFLPRGEEFRVQDTNFLLDVHTGSSFKLSFPWEMWELRESRYGSYATAQGTEDILYLLTNTKKKKKVKWNSLHVDTHVRQKRFFTMKYVNVIQYYNQSYNGTRGGFAQWTMHEKWSLLPIFIIFRYFKRIFFFHPLNVRQWYSFFADVVTIDTPKI